MSGSETPPRMGGTDEPRLDGEDPIRPLPPRRRRALGHDPLADLGDDSRFWRALPPAPRRAAPGGTDARAGGPVHAPRRGEADALAGVRVRPPADLFDRLLDADARRRIEALRALAPEEGPPDPFGFSPEAARRSLPVLLALYRRWFRVRSEGHEHIPRRGAFILAANHGGLLPFDGAMTAVDVLLHTDPPRLLRPLADRFVERVPWVRDLFPRIGAVRASRDSFRALLREGHGVLVFPEGVGGICKPVSQRYHLQRFHTGFVRQALAAGVPLVPTAVVGSDDQAPILYDVKPLARALGLPVAPITPTFPWFGPLGLLPYPVSYRIVYGEPMDLSARHGVAADDDERVRDLARQVRRAIQHLLDRARS